jgi:hypothetical protein
MPRTTGLGCNGARIEEDQARGKEIRGLRIAALDEREHMATTAIFYDPAGRAASSLTGSSLICACPRCAIRPPSAAAWQRHCPKCGGRLGTFSTTRFTRKIWRKLDPTRPWPWAHGDSGRGGRGCIRCSQRLNAARNRPDPPHARGRSCSGELMAAVATRLGREKRKRVNDCRNGYRAYSRAARHPAPGRCGVGESAERREKTENVNKLIEVLDGGPEARGCGGSCRNCLPQSREYFGLLHRFVQSRITYVASRNCYRPR